MDEEGLASEAGPQSSAGAPRSNALIQPPRTDVTQENPTATTDVKIDDDSGSMFQAQVLENGVPGQPPMSKSQLKKLKRQRLWEDRKEDRKRLRKEKRHQQTARRRAERATKIAEAEAAGLDPSTVLESERPVRIKRRAVPVTFVLDCDFEEFMSEKELISLSSQITRSYSENRAGKFQASIVISSWKGKLRQRFETLLKNHHLAWKGVHFVEGDFVDAGREALGIMQGTASEGLIEVLQPRPSESPELDADPAIRHDDDGKPAPDPPCGDPSIVYLTSDSPYTLDRLEPYTSYVVGGLVDRNREKGLCFKRANERGVRTAKLPIGDYMVMASRKVLTTNQVVEIMGKWLESGDWRTAFQHAIPKRKGGIVRGTEDREACDGDEAEDGDTDEEPHGSDTEPVPEGISASRPGSDVAEAAHAAEPDTVSKIESAPQKSAGQADPLGS